MAVNRRLVPCRHGELRRHRLLSSQWKASAFPRLIGNVVRLAVTA